MTINPVIIVSANDIAFPTATPADKLRLAVAGYLAPYKGKTLSGHTCSLNHFLTWCADPEHTVDPLHCQRGHIELYIRWMETTGWASATIAGRYDVVRGNLPGKDPCRWITRPSVDEDFYRAADRDDTAMNRPNSSGVRNVRRCPSAKKMGDREYALACLLGLSALRIAEACSLNIEDMTRDGGYDIINFVGKGGNTYAMPLSIPVMRAVHEVIDGRTEGPILVTKWKTRMSKSSARRTIKLIAAAAAVNEDISPHSLRRSFATTAIATGVPIRDLQVTLRHKSIKTTTIYDRGGKSHDRNSTHRVSSFIAGIADM